MIDFLRIDMTDLTYFAIVAVVAIGLISLIAYSMRPRRTTVIETRRMPM